MIQPPPIDQLIGKLSEAIPQGLGGQSDQIKSQMKTIMSRWLEEMEFVTREEFEVQKAVLQKTRQKLDSLEQILQQIDSESSQK